MEQTANAPIKWSWIIILSSITSTLSVFLFSYDTVVISGAELKNQVLWKLSPQLYCFLTETELYGTIIDTLIGI